MSDGTMRAVYYLVVGAVLLGGGGCSAPDPETASLETAKQALTVLPPQAPLPAVPSVMRKKGGVLDSTWLTPVDEDDGPLDDGDACETLHGMYGIPYGSSPGTINGALQDSYGSDVYNCADFSAEFLDNTTTAVLDRSVRILPDPDEDEECRFENASVEITVPNVKFDCGGSTFDGGGTLEDGLTLLKNPKDSGRAADSPPALPTITNVSVSYCKFENYKRSGVMISNKFNRENPADQVVYNGKLGATPVEPWDSLHAPSDADYLRAHSPSGFYLGSITVKNTGNAAIYLHDHVQNIDINRLVARDTRLAVYLDHGSRLNTVRNSCFLQQKQPQDSGDKGPREFVAVDSSAGNTIKSNLFYKNTEAAVRLYKNYSERVELPTQFFRRQTAHENNIASNIIVGPDDPAAYTEDDYAAINIGSRQWLALTEAQYTTFVDLDGDGDEDDEIKAAGDDPLPQRGDDGEYIYRDYAEDNRVVANVFFAPGLSISVQDDRNLVYGNTFYDSKTNSSILVGRVGPGDDVEYGRQALRDNLLWNNRVQYFDYDVPPLPPAPTAIPIKLFDFRDESMEYNGFQGNRFRDKAVCRSPFYVPATNVPEDVCRFGSPSAPTFYMQGPKVEHFYDGGRVHGSIDVECTTNGWLVKNAANYCCSGDGCTQTSIAGKYFN